MTVGVCKSDSASNGCNREFRQQETLSGPAYCSGSVCCRLLSFFPYCRTPSVGGGRSAVPRSLPEPTESQSGSFRRPGLPGESVGPKRNETKRNVRETHVHAQFEGSKLLLFFLALPPVLLFVAQSSRLKHICLARPTVYSSMSSTPPAQKVGQALARELWAELDTEEKAWKRDFVWRSFGPAMS